jgi:ribosome-associated protein
MSKMSTEDSLKVIIEGIQELKGENIVSINFSQIENSEFEYFVICEGNSNTHVTAIADSVVSFVRENNVGILCGKDGYENSEWIILDFANIFVHVFQPHIRQYYNIEELWADCPIKEHN